MSNQHRASLYALAVAGFAVAFTTAGPVDGRRRSAPPCEGARYLLQGEGLLAGSAGPSTDAFVVSPAQVALDDVCPPMAPKQLRSTRKGATSLRVVWPACRGFTGRVRLKGRIVDGCARLVGTLKARRFKRSIEALRSRCGDGRLDERGGEQCEPPGLPTCDDQCRIVPPVSTTTTLPVRLDVWHPATVPYDPSCAACERLETVERLPHFGLDLVFDVNRAIDDAPAQWGDCLAAVIRCAETGGTLGACVAGSSCPAACKALFAERAPGADVPGALRAFSGVFLARDAPCRPAEEGAP